MDAVFHPRVRLALGTSSLLPASDLAVVGAEAHRATRTATGDPINPRGVRPFDRRTHRTALETTASNRRWLEACARRRLS